MKKFYGKLLSRDSPFIFQGMLQTKLSRWCSQTLASAYALKGTRILRNIAKHVPPCVIWNLINSWCNGWCTDRRLQIKSSQCFLNSGCHGEDSIEHYAVCQCHWRVFNSRFRKNVLTHSISVFLGFEADSIEESVLHACHMYAVKIAVDRRRWQGARLGEITVPNLIWNAHLTAAMYHHGLANRLRSLT